MQKQRAYFIPIQLLFWIFFLSLPVIFASSQPGSSVSFDMFTRPAMWLYLLFFPASFYVHQFVAWPILHNRRQPVLYALLVIAIILVALWLRPFDSMVSALRTEGMAPPNIPGPHAPGGKGLPPRIGPRFDIISLVMLLCQLAVGIAWHLALQWRETEKRVLQAETERSKAELAFLKAQINPHFLFNTLNNLYAMAQADNKATADGILRLSNIMRYVTDEASLDAVMLDDELDCIENYIELQRLRLSEKTTINVQLSNRLLQAEIAPLLLLPFVENVFKHGVSNHEASSLSITIDTDAAGNLHLHTLNRKFGKRSLEERTGLGVANTRQRLEQLYPDRHQVVIHDNADTYKVLLTIQLNEPA